MADEQKTNGNGQLPWQIRAIAFVGVPSAIALFLVWNLTTSQTQNLADTKSQLATVAQVLAVANQGAVHFNEGSERRDEQLARLLRQICVNTANNSADRSNCLE